MTTQGRITLKEKEREREGRRRRLVRRAKPIAPGILRAERAFKEEEEERLFTATPFADQLAANGQLPPPVPGISVDRALFQAGFPLGVAQRAERPPTTLFGRAGLAEIAAQQAMLGLFGLKGAKERSKEVGEELRRSFEPTLGRLDPTTGLAAQDRPIKEILKEAEAQPFGQERLPYSGLKLGTLMGALQALQERGLETLQVSAVALSLAIPSDRGKAETRYKELRAKGVGFIDAARQAMQETPQPPGLRGALEALDPTILLPGVGFGKEIIKTPAKVAPKVGTLVTKTAAETAVRVPVRPVQEAGFKFLTGKPVIRGAAPIRRMTWEELGKTPHITAANGQDMVWGKLKDAQLSQAQFRRQAGGRATEVVRITDADKPTWALVQPSPSVPKAAAPKPVPAPAAARGAPAPVTAEAAPSPSAAGQVLPPPEPAAPAGFGPQGPVVRPVVPIAPGVRNIRPTPLSDEELAAQLAQIKAKEGADVARVPLMITREQRQVLLDQGLTRAQVDALTPQQAQDILSGSAGAVPPAKPPVTEAAPVTAQPERGFITHTGESPMGSPILRELYDKEPIVYSPITNRETLQKASEAVNADPIAARARLMADAPINPETMVDDLAQGFVLMRKAANEGNVVELRDLSKRIAERYTPIAQALQVASTIDKLSPEGLFVYTQRIIEQAVAKGEGPAVANRLRTAARRAAVKEATANAAADVASAEAKVAQARTSVSNAAETAARARTPKGNQRAKDLQYLIDDTVREVQAKLTPAERQAIIKAKAILKQSVAEMDVATANSFLDRAAELKNLDGEARVKALMDLVDEVRQLPQVQAGIVAGKPLKSSVKLLKQQAADLAQLVDRTARNVFQQLNSVDRLAVARVKAILRRTDVELPQGMAEELLQEAHNLRGLPLAERASALNKLTQKIKSFDPVAKELARKKAIADAEARVRQAARQAANDLAALIDASSRKVVKHTTTADRQAISQAKTVLRRYGAELPSDMAEDFLARARALNNLPEAEQAAGVKALVNEIKEFNPVKQAREELARLRAQAAEAKRGAKDLLYLTNEDLRVSKARLRNVERETIRSAKARLKDAGVEMPEELAQSFLDRVKALRGITDEYDQMRAAQSLLADVHNLVPGSKINTFFDIIGLPRIFQAAYDLSFSLRQGIMHAWAHPKQWGGMFKAGLKSFASEDAALAADRQFFKRPLYKPGQEAGLEYIDRWGSIGQQEETYINSWTERVPGIRQSNRAYTVQGNKLRADAFDAKVMEWLPPDVREEVYWGRKRFETLDELVAATGKTRKDFERLAQWQNVLTGRGDLGNFLRSNNQWLNALLYAPRFAVSRFEVPIFAVRNMAANPALRKMVALDLASSIVGSTAALYMLSQLPGVTVEWDPRSSDWRKVKYGPLRISLDGGFDVLIRQVIQLSLGERKSTTTGEIADVRRTAVIARFLVTKFSPTASVIRDTLDQETIFGEPLDTPEAWGKRLAEAWEPFVAQDVYEATQELGWPGIGVAPLSGFGLGVQAYEPRRRPSPLRSRRGRLVR